LNILSFNVLENYFYTAKLIFLNKETDKILLRFCEEKTNIIFDF